MKKNEKRMVAILFAIVLMASLPVQSVAECSITPTIPGSEKRVQMAKETLGSSKRLPESLSIDDCFQLIRENPQLGEQVFRHIEKMAKPIEEVLSVPKSFPARKVPIKNGAYVRDGQNTGHFEFEEFAATEEIDEMINTQAKQLRPPLKSVSDFGQVNYPCTNQTTSSICKIYVIKDGNPYCGTGFFVGNTVVATAAHVIYNKGWERLDGLYSNGWADQVYVCQAYDPTVSTDSEYRPYGRKQVQLNNMAVGASWKTDGGWDNDWGVVVLKDSTISGPYTYLQKKRIIISGYYGVNVTTYGYPFGGGHLPMYYSNLKTVEGAAYTYRCLYARSASGGNPNVFEGMSGSPIVDNYGYVVGIYLGKTNSDPMRAIAISFDVWLYNKLKSYE